MTMPDHIHHYSPVNRISIELPIGFEEQEEDAEAGVVVYADDLDDMDDMDSDVGRDGTGGNGQVAHGGRVITRVVTLPAGHEAPERHAGTVMEAASASAGRPGCTIDSREEITVDGVPAVRQTLRYTMEGIGPVVAVETVLQVHNLLLTIFAVAPESREAEYYAPFIHASDTARIVVPEQFRPVTGVRSWSSEELRVSLLFPPEWEPTWPEENTMRLFGPECREFNDYRPTFSILMGEPTGFGEEWFESFRGEALNVLQTTYEGFTLRTTELFTLSSLVETGATWYEWDPGHGQRAAQLQALVSVDRYRMYLINAATLLPLAEDHLPIFHQILRSARFL